MLKTKFFFSLLIFLFAGTQLFATSVTGKVIDKDSTVIAFANVYIKNSTYGTITNQKGIYFLELTQGEYTIVYSFVGFQAVEKNISIKKNQTLVLDVILIEEDVVLEDIEIVADKIDRAKKIIRNARDRRKTFLDSIRTYECDIYVKTSIEKESEVPNPENSKDFASYLKNEKLNLIEYLAKVYYKAPNRFFENITAYHNYSEQAEADLLYMSAEYGEHDITPHQYSTGDNPNIFYKNSSTGNFNFYENMMELPMLCQQPLISPIANNSYLYYKYEFVEAFLTDSQRINKIKVTPLNKQAALFYGNIFIEDSTWALSSVDLFINEAVLLRYENFNIIQNYKKIDTDIYLPSRTDITYTIKENAGYILGTSKITSKNYIVNKDISSKMFGNQIIKYSDDAFDKDSTYWIENRFIPMKYKEIEFIKKTDSIQDYYASDEYLDRQDSIFNAIRWWTPFIYYGIRNHYTDTEFYISGLVEQVVPLGVGGYRHRLPFHLKKRLANGMLVETNFKIDYGFANQDLKGTFGIGLTYFPRKFVRTFVEIGDNYEMINTYASFTQLLSRSNYVRNRSLQISQRMEVFNGFYAELRFLYSKQFPINDIKLEQWSNYVFEDMNTPVEFLSYIKTEVNLQVKYVIGQKYYFRKKVKYVIATDYPELAFLYRKGLPNIFNSEVNFDYIELAAKHDMKLARMGEMRWQIKTGIFFNKHDLRILEYKYFRGSDIIFFIDPVNTMQLLGPTLNTSHQFLQANIIFHFESIINKIPILKLTKLTLAAGAGTLNIPNQNFYHAEIFAGVERVFKIKRQPFRIGIYALTSDNTLSKADYSFKIGFAGFHEYSNKWSY